MVPLWFVWSIDAHTGDEGMTQHWACGFEDHIRNSRPFHRSRILSQLNTIELHNPLTYVLGPYSKWMWADINNKTKNFGRSTRNTAPLPTKPLSP